MNKRQIKILMALFLSCILLLSSIYTVCSVTYEDSIYSSNRTK